MKKYQLRQWKTSEGEVYTSFEADSITDIINYIIENYVDAYAIRMDGKVLD